MERARDPGLVESARRERAARPPKGARLAALVPAALLGAVAAAVLVLRAAPAWLAGATLGAVLAAVVLWIVVSVLWPGRADRACPACGADAVERVDPRSTVGKRCRACGWRDADESAWILAEDDGAPLEPIVLAQRGRARGGPAHDERRPG